MAQRQNKPSNTTKIISKVPILCLRPKTISKSNSTMTTTQTVFLAQLPIADAKGQVPAPPDKIPGLYATGKAPASSSTGTKSARKSIQFTASAFRTPLSPSVLPLSEEEEEEEVIEHDTATQTQESAILIVPVLDITSMDEPEMQKEGTSTQTKTGLRQSKGHTRKT